MSLLETEGDNWICGSLEPGLKGNGPISPNSVQPAAHYPPNNASLPWWAILRWAILTFTSLPVFQNVSKSLLPCRHRWKSQILLRQAVLHSCQAWADKVSANEENKKKCCHCFTTDTRHSMGWKMDPDDFPDNILLKLCQQCWAGIWASEQIQIWWKGNLGPVFCQLPRMNWQTGHVLPVLLLLYK